MEATEYFGLFGVSASDRLVIGQGAFQYKIKWMYKNVFISSIRAWHMHNCTHSTQLYPKRTARHRPEPLLLPCTSKSWYPSELIQAERTAMLESQKSLEREGGTRVLVSDRLQCQTVTHYKNIPQGCSELLLNSCSSGPASVFQEPTRLPRGYPTSLVPPPFPL